MKKVLALRHVSFEDLGQLEPLLARRGVEIRYFEVGVDSFSAVSPLDADLVVVLGGPIAAYDMDAIPTCAQKSPGCARACSTICRRWEFAWAHN
jgi:GMP synthase (glutamine-hydrolysing)